MWERERCGGVLIEEDAVSIVEMARDMIDCHDLHAVTTSLAGERVKVS